MYPISSRSGFGEIEGVRGELGFMVFPMLGACFP